MARMQVHTSRIPFVIAANDSRDTLIIVEAQFGT
jgi:hypothetical protein